MKHLLMILLALIIPASTGAMVPPDHFWFCAQLGLLDGQKVVVHTSIHENDADIPHEEKEKQFTKHVIKATKNQFEPAFDATCHTFRDYRDAKHDYISFMKRALKLKFKLYEICPFKCEGEQDDQEDTSSSP